MITNPAAKQKVEAGDYLVIISNGLNKKKIQQVFKVQEGWVVH